VKRASKIILREFYHRILR